MNNENLNPRTDETFVIDLTPAEYVDTTVQKETENPVILIGSDAPVDSAKAATGPQPPRRRDRKTWIVALALLFVLVCIALVGVRYYMRNYYVEISVSCKPSENIEKLKAATQKGVRPEVVFTHDSVGTVALNMYEIRGLKAELTYDEPDSTDQDVYLYSRCADYGKRNIPLGTLVVDGKKVVTDRSRLGYCAMLGSNTVIGIARNDAVADYVEENGGSFFRQFILVSDGEIPRVFHLHKKVERRALARMDNQMYYIESCNPETMWDFADAIRKYGFIDAIYITGGKCHSYYRTADGTCHNIGLPESMHIKTPVPWLVFRK